MSVALSSKSGEFGDDSINLMAPAGRSKFGWIPQISGWCIGAAVCLGCLLLILILGVVAHNSSAIGHRDSMCENMIDSLTADRESLRAERDQLKDTSSNLTKEIEALQSQYKAVAASRDKLQEEKITLRDERDQLKIISNNLTQQMDILKSQYNAMNASRAKLQEEVDRLSLNRTRRECHQGWKAFGDKCYYFSTSGVTKSWALSRKDCLERGADLAIVTTREELDFVSKTYAVTWIGLSDKDREGKWVWVDGTELQGDEFWQDGEPNNSDGDEDCAEVSRSAKRFNDVPCSRRFSWACEL
ncbi:C-type lectin domain family 10 member A-like isoform X1 [Centropristis striata]|uniref:C-type lectin domain family 10 member A-like isoform X1 n=1 Tax=Centropristis striata TaxID=184440 RepID=UPI0027DF4EBD|nr:C-type lectin domain family 10 member A-like isoform X1 [Centropristis striata]